MGIASGIIKRLLYPHHLWRVISLQWNRKKVNRTYDDAQLKLYHQLLPGDFLHYGYFSDPAIEPQDITLRMVYDAQEQYGQNIVDLITDKESEILDIGCGMGGLLRLMNKQGYKSIALTPDKNQVHHISQTYPNEILGIRFEDMEMTGNKERFGTVITSESLQYLDQDISLPMISALLKPNGRWIACDYFRIGDAAEKSGHEWPSFLEKLSKYGLKIISQRDITPHILPTIGYVNMWATQIGMPIKDFALGKLKVKAPGLHYALEGSLPLIEQKIDKNIKTIDPVEFAAKKKYMLLVIEKV
ncbi:MAG: methyltransferase domain protein [Bacteroidetes bacterium]|nr:methyltransferase domain protein [Bacteroidota bacterium]